MIQKLLYLLLLLPFHSFGQCPQWVGRNADSTLLLEKVAEKYLGVPLAKTDDAKDKTNIDFSNSACSCEFLYSIAKQKKKIKGKKKEVLVSKIVIVGGQAKVKKMFTEYFYPLVKPCAASGQKESVVYNGMSISYSMFVMHGEKLGEIILRGN